MSVLPKQIETAPPRYAGAIEHVLAHTAPIRDTESLPLAQCGGRVLAAELKADRDLPPFNRATMDGYALRAADFISGKPFPVVSTIPAGHHGTVDVPRGACVAIATGAPLPPQLDAVLQHERSDRANPVTFNIEAIEPGHAVHPRGADARRGQTILSVATLLYAHHLGIAASVGATSLSVVRRPRIITITSGDEIIDPAKQPEMHQVRNSNGPMLAQLLRRMGGEVVRHTHVLDSLPAVRTTIAPALDERPPIDILITVGGISAGERDHFRTVFEERGVMPIVTRALLQPGGPIYVARHPNGCIVIGLPGNPVSVLACACLFVWPVVQRMLGLAGALPWRTVELAAAVKPNATRQAYRPAKLERDGRVTVPQWAGSGDLVHTAATDGLLELPIQKEPVEAGTTLRFLPWP